MRKLIIIILLLLIQTKNNNFYYKNNYYKKKKNYYYQEAEEEAGATTCRKYPALTCRPVNVSAKIKKNTKQRRKGPPSCPCARKNGKCVNCICVQKGKACSDCYPGEVSTCCNQATINRNLQSPDVPNFQRKIPTNPPHANDTPNNHNNTHNSQTTPSRKENNIAPTELFIKNSQFIHNHLNMAPPGLEVYAINGAITTPDTYRRETHCSMKNSEKSSPGPTNSTLTTSLSPKEKKKNKSIKCSKRHSGKPLRGTPPPNPSPPNH
eukprot:GHVR01124502.1.p1 GENE.GHVR01124502.1~~GHVR01124502.1.p1  ORF type:complete len:277 (+),score=32.28 GHVR01124502.1:38-832(+)